MAIRWLAWDELRMIWKKWLWSNSKMLSPHLPGRMVESHDEQQPGLSVFSLRLETRPLAQRPEVLITWSVNSISVIFFFPLSGVGLSPLGPDLGMWDLWWDKVALGRFSPSISVSPAIVVRSTNYSTITLMYHPGKMYNRPICGRSTGAYTNLGDLQKDLMGVKSHPTK
jgi:hypothetical protein